MSKFSRDLAHQKSLKSLNFWQSYLKNKKVDVFGPQSIQQDVTVSVAEHISTVSDRTFLHFLQLRGWNILPRHPILSCYLPHAANINQYPAQYLKKIFAYLFLVGMSPCDGCLTSVTLCQSLNRKWRRADCVSKT